MDHFAAGVMRASSVTLGSGNVFSKRFGTRIELPGPSSLPGAGHRKTLARIAGLAQVAEIRWLVIPFVSVAVIYR